MRHVPRIALALIAGLLAGVICAQAVATGTMFVLGVMGPADFLVLTGILANSVLVPVASGLTLGFIAPRWPLPLAVATVLLSLTSTVAALGYAGLPTGWKIVQYLMQLALVYLAARWSSRRQLRRPAIARGTA